MAGVKAVLFCAWLSWSRFRVVLPIRDKSLPSVIGCIDATLRRFGGCPTYALTDYVPRHIIGLLFPTALCDRRRHRDVITAANGQPALAEGT